MDEFIPCFGCFSVHDFRSAAGSRCAFAWPSLLPGGAVAGDSIPPTEFIPGISALLLSPWMPRHIFFLLNSCIRRNLRRRAAIIISELRLPLRAEIANEHFADLNLCVSVNRQRVPRDFRDNRFDLEIMYRSGGGAGAKGRRKAHHSERSGMDKAKLNGPPRQSIVFDFFASAFI